MTGPMGGGSSSSSSDCNGWSLSSKFSSSSV